MSNSLLFNRLNRIMTQTTQVSTTQIPSYSSKWHEASAINASKIDADIQSQLSGEFRRILNSDPLSTQAKADVENLLAKISMNRENLPYKFVTNAERMLKHHAHYLQPEAQPKKHIAADRGMFGTVGEKATQPAKAKAPTAARAGQLSKADSPVARNASPK